MKQTLKHFCRPTFALVMCMACAMMFDMPATAAVVQRTNTTTATSSRPTTSRGQAVTAAARTPTVVKTATTTEDVAADTTNTEEVSEPEIDTMMPTEETVVVIDKSSQFGNNLNAQTERATSDTAADALAEQIRRQRAALDAQSASEAATTAITQSLAGGVNSCDANLRACMQSKCGTDYSKCRGDTDTLWGTKMDACRRDLNCTGEEYRLFAAEIKADRDMNARIASYNAIVECGNNYNDCIITQCGVTYDKCLGKSAGDAAISKCATIAKNCTQQDSGLAARTMEVFGTLRQAAEVQIQKDEQRLYALREQMRSVCARLGAMFDERSLDCVYTVEFYAGEGATLYASKKAYAGSSFDCTQNWFGVDITTFKENAYRATRDQTAASSALMGSGVGMAVGAVSSGMLNRAIDRQKAEKAYKNAKEEAEGSKKGDSDGGG